MSRYVVSDMRERYADIPVDRIEHGAIQRGDYLTAGLTTYRVDNVRQYVAWSNVDTTIIASGHGADRVGVQRSWTVTSGSPLVKAWREVTP